MGTWGTGPFDDDGASDWAWDFKRRTTGAWSMSRCEGRRMLVPMRIWRRRTAKLLGLPLPLSRRPTILQPLAFLMRSRNGSTIIERRGLPLRVNLRGELFTECSPTTRSSWNSGRKPESLARPEPRP